jgi:hypothetical protein
VVSCQLIGKRRQVLLDDRVERSLFRLVAPIRVNRFLLVPGIPEYFPVDATSSATELELATSRLTP